MVSFADWCFEVDIASTMTRTTAYSEDHCTCAYCRNFYLALDRAYPSLRPFLATFGIYADGPSEVMPIEPNLIVVCYRVTGQILHQGQGGFLYGDIPVTVEACDDGTFLLWVGELEVPWLLEEDMDEVVSPANLPEFMERMERVLLQRSANVFYEC